MGGKDFLKLSVYFQQFPFISPSKEMCGPSLNKIGSPFLPQGYSVLSLLEIISVVLQKNIVFQNVISVFSLHAYCYDLPSEVVILIHLNKLKSLSTRNAFSQRMNYGSPLVLKKTLKSLVLSWKKAKPFYHL